MIRVIQIIAILTTFLFAVEKPDGGYATWQDYEKGIPTYSIEKFSFSKLSAINGIRGDGVAILYRNEAGKDRIWKSHKQGPLTIVKTGFTYYLYKPVPQSGFTHSSPSVVLHYHEKYSWYTITKTNQSGPIIGANGQTIGTGNTWTTSDHFVLNMKTKEVHKLNKHILREILKDNPKLAKEYEGVRFKNRKAYRYFQQYINDNEEEIEWDVIEE